MNRRWLVCVCVLTLSCLGLAGATPPVQAQSILEKLEQKVRDNLELDAPQTKAGEKKTGAPEPVAGELPAPNSLRNTPPPTPVPPNSGVPNANASGNLPGSSILDAPALPAGGLDPNANAVEGIYLGLEAESLSGGGIGARVVKVTDNSPAWRAGFKVNDIILAIDGFAISNLDTMVDRLSLRRPGETVKVLLLRGTRNVELTAVLQSTSLAQRIQGINPNSNVPSPLTPAGNAWLGVVVADLSSAFRTQFGLRAYRAAAVTNVTKGSPADAVSIQPGDAIVGVDGRPIESARELLDWMATKRPGDFVSLNVMRGTRATLLETTLGTDPKYQTSIASRVPAADPFDPSSLNVASENTVPNPAASDSLEVQELRGELRQARQELSSLAQRVAELEALLKPK
ncbi:MAG: PDZ domain-containing protein [Pirellulaceae bacterium]|nr:PDZ domain-containing protein [Pirellulaceae bacterium]